jgi:hypothetical protein
MADRCDAEMCGNWTGEGCACLALGLVPDVVVPEVHFDHDIHGPVIEVHPDRSTTLDEDCDCPQDCAGCEREGVHRG